MSTIPQLEKRKKEHQDVCLTALGLFLVPPIFLLLWSALLCLMHCLLPGPFGWILSLRTCLILILIWFYSWSLQIFIFFFCPWPFNHLLCSATQSPVLFSPWAQLTYFAFCLFSFSSFYSPNLLHHFLSQFSCGVILIKANTTLSINYSPIKIKEKERELRTSGYMPPRMKKQVLKQKFVHKCPEQYYS